MRTKLLLSVLFTASLSAVLLAVVSGRLPSPWDSGTAEARTAVLTSGAFAPLAGPASTKRRRESRADQLPGPAHEPQYRLAVADNTYSIAFRVFDADTAGTEVWTETQTVAVAAGLFSVHLGSDTPFPAGAFDGTARYLEVQVGADPAMTPRLLFTSVAYAFHALAADVSKDLDCNGCVDPSEVQLNYAASNVPSGPATDVACIDCIAGSEAQFNYAGSIQRGRPGVGRELHSTRLGCIYTTEIIDNSVVTADVQFNYAGSPSEGGAATDVACANPSGCRRCRRTCSSTTPAARARAARPRTSTALRRLVASRRRDCRWSGRINRYH